MSPVFQSGPAQLIRLNLTELFRLSGDVRVLSALLERGGANPSDVRAVCGALAQLAAQARRMGLAGAECAANSALAAFQDSAAPEHLAGHLAALRGILGSELAQAAAVLVPSQRADWLGAQRPFGDAVYFWLPAARADLTAAANCFAVAQFTAAAFHCMRAVETAARREAGPVKQRTWGAYCEALRLKAKSAGGDARVRWGRIAEGLDLFRRAWWNGTMHADRFFTEEEAVVILMAARGFLRNLAEGAAQG